MSENRDERDEFDDLDEFRDDADDLDDADDRDDDDLDDLNDLDDSNDLDDLDDRAAAGVPWPIPGYPPVPRPARRGRRVGLFAVTAVLAGAAGFGVVAVAMHGVTGSPAAASSSPSAAAPSHAAPSHAAPGNAAPGNGQTLLPPQTSGGTIPSTGPGEELSLEIGGKVTAVSTTSITIGGDGQPVTAVVTKATKITGKADGIGGIKVGDFVSATISGTDGTLTAATIQDPASLP